MKATTGTNVMIWGNWLAGIGTFLAAFLTPDLLTSLLGSKYGFLAPIILLVINALGHGTTGNSATSVLPGVISATPSISQQG